MSFSPSLGGPRFAESWPAGKADMTRLRPNQACEACGGPLVLPQIATGVVVPKDTDYVCLKCKLPYRWMGTPPQLVVLAQEKPGADGREDS